MAGCVTLSSSLRSRVTHPVLLVIVGIVSVQVGAAFAKSAFDLASPTALVWLRLASFSAILLVVVRPRVRGLSRHDWGVAISFGAALGTMNWAIYEAFARLPLGIAVTIEFIGPLSVALASSRRWRDLLWVALAATGVVLLGLEPGTVTLVGVLFALLAGACWAAYILLSRATGARWEGLDGLALASAVAVVGLTPLALVTAHGLGNPRVWLFGALAGLMSSVIPYSLDLIALRSIKPSLYAVLMSLEPAAAALAAIVILREGLSALQWLAVGCVVAASAGATLSGRPSEAPVEPGTAPSDGIHTADTSV